MFDEMPASEFPAFLAAFWSEKGWTTSVTENEDGTYLVSGDRDDGTRGLIGVRPETDVEIGASEVEDFAAFCDRRDAGVRVMATRGRFTTGARSAAEAGDVHLLDPNELASSVREEGVEELVEEYSSEDDEDDGSLLDALPLPASGAPSGIPVVPVAVAAVVVLAAVFASGPLLGLVPFVGDAGGSDSAASFTAFSLADAGNGSASAAWDARVQAELRTANNTYRPNDGETFVVVQLNVTAGESAATLRSEHLALAVNGTNYGPQSFENASRQFRGKLLPVRATPGQSSRALVVFSVPEGFDGATLVERSDGPGLRFARADLEFGVEE